MGTLLRAVAMAGTIALTLFFNFAVQAASLTNITGQVMVNIGGGYQPVSGEVTLNPGDKILVGPNGSAELVYADGTVIKVGPGQVTTVASAAPGGGGLPGGATVPGAGGGIGTTGLVIGGLAIAGGVGAALALSGGGDSPASP